MLGICSFTLLSPLNNRRVSSLDQVHLGRGIHSPSALVYVAVSLVVKYLVYKAKTLSAKAKKVNFSKPSPAIISRPSERVTLMS